MDSRNFINEPIPEISSGGELEEIFNLQKELLSKYIGIEGLPEYPIDVNSKKNQIILKDFTGRVIEELGEGYESMIETNSLGKKWSYFHPLKGDDISWTEDYDKAYSLVKSYIQNTNEEFADALHFIVELMIYTNIHPEDVYAFLKKGIAKHGINYDKPIQTLSDVMTLGGVLVSSTQNTHTWEIPIGEDICIPTMNKSGGRFLQDASVMLWDITYSLSISRNCLKNKPWKQDCLVSDENLYQNLICESFVKLMGFYKNMGYTADSLFKVYFLKNRVNKFRQSSGY